MERVKLEANSRERKGKLTALRKTGLVPGILYGRKQEPKNLQLPTKNLEKVLAAESGLNTIFDLLIDSKPMGLVRIREYQADPITRKFLHVDFQTVDLKEKIEVEVPVHIVGKPEGVKQGGILEQQRRILHLKCFVTSIPDHIEIDVSHLVIGQSVHADEVKLPEGVEFPHATNFPIVGVIPPTKEEEAKPADVAAVVVEGEVAPVAEGAAAAGSPKPEKGKAEEPKGKEEKKKKEEKK